MALKYSTGARQFMAGYGSLKDAFENGRLEIYTGAQPATADAAVTGTLLCTITSASLARTAEVLATGTMTLTGGAAGSVDTLTVNGIDILGGAVAYNTSLAQTAADVAAACEKKKGFVEYEVTSSGAVVTIKALPGTGASVNGFIVACTSTTLTQTTANMAGGVTAANGLLFNHPVAGVITKSSTQTWSGVNAATGTAGYYRLYGSVADAGGIDATGELIREDGLIAASGAQMDMANTGLTAAATTTITAWQRTITTA